jgi:hypothetical protein
VKAAAGGPAPAGKAPARLPRSTVIALAVMIPATLTAATAGQGWRSANRELEAERQRIAAMARENVELGGPQRLLAPQNFQICAAVPDGRVRLEWVAAAYADQDRMRLFDSASCADWRTRELKSGKLPLTHTSALPECNWDGRVVFAAAAWSVDAEDAEGPYTYSNVSFATYATDVEDCYKVR